MSRRPPSPFALMFLSLSACTPYPTLSDHGSACVTARVVDGQHQLAVEADSRDCASDHRGARFSCSIDREGTQVTIETSFRDGRDPNDACAPPLTATCSLDVEPGVYTVAFAGVTRALAVPGTDVVCLPSGDSEGDPPDGTESESDTQ